MYSPINEMHPFETSTTTVSTPSMNEPTTTFTPNMELHTPNMDYVRRFSYADLLSNHSEASLSDYEQQTPSPSNDYEEYIFHHQHPSSLTHPLDEQKRRMSMIEASTTCYTSPILPLNYLNPNHSIFSPNQNQNNNGNIYYSPSPLSHPFQPQHHQHPHHHQQHQQQQQQQRSMSYSAGDVLSSMVPTTTMFDYNHLSNMDNTMNMNPMDTLSNHHHNDLLDSMNRDRLNSVSSVTSSPIPNTNNINNNDINNNNNNGQQVKVTKNGKVKQCRSRGRRVSSNPTNCAKMFTCKHDDCGKVFKRSEHLKRHIRSIHTLEKPFECPYQSCSKRFSRSDNLNQHIRIHRHTNKDKSNNASSNNNNSNSSRQPAASFNMPYV